MAPSQSFQGKSLFFLRGLESSVAPLSSSVPSTRHLVSFHLFWVIFIQGSCGDDSRIRLWDMRAAKHPIIDHVAPSHWAWRLAFNPFYSQMLITSGTDLTANLWLVPSMGKGQVGGTGWLGADLAFNTFCCLMLVTSGADLNVCL